MYTNTDSLNAWETHCDEEGKHCKLKPYKLAPLSADRQKGRGDDVFAHVTAAQALPRPSDPAFRQVVGEQVARTGMPPLAIFDLLSGAKIMVVGGPWGNIRDPPVFVAVCCFCHGTLPGHSSCSALGPDLFHTLSAAW